MEMSNKVERPELSSLTDDTQNDELQNSKRKQKGWSRFCFTIEPIMFLVQFFTHLTAGITIDSLQLNVCHQNFNMTRDECLQKLPLDIKSQIEAMTADVNMINNMIQGICPVILVLCIGPWSDINGRKPFLLWAMRGYACFYFLWGLLSLFPKIPVMCFVIPAIPLSLSGGWVSVLVACQSYIADVWPEHLRPFRIGVNIFCSVSGSVLANTISSWIFYSTGKYSYQIMYFSSAVLALVGHLYVSYVLKETIIRKGKKTRLLKLSHIKSILVVLIAKPIKGRFITLLTMAILTTEITSWVGEANLIYMIGKSSFNWTLKNFNNFNSVTTIISAFSPMVGMWILKEKLNLHSYIILVISSTCMFLFNILKSFSENEKMFWIVSCLSRLVTFIGPCVDTELSLLVNENDIGKAFAFSSLLDALSPVLTLPLFNQLYKVMLPDKTLRMYLLAAFFSSITATSSIALLWNKYTTKNKTDDADVIQELNTYEQATPSK